MLCDLYAMIFMKNNVLKMDNNLSVIVDFYYKYSKSIPKIRDYYIRG